MTIPCPFGVCAQFTEITLGVVCSYFNDDKALPLQKWQCKNGTRTSNISMFQNIGWPVSPVSKI